MEDIAALRETLSFEDLEKRIFDAGEELREIFYHNHYIIVSSGTIGSGKSHAMKCLRQYGLPIFPENPKDPILRMYYGDKPRFSFRLQLHLMGGRFATLTWAHENIKGVIGVDRSFYEDMFPFTQTLYEIEEMTKREAEDVKEQFNAIAKEIPKPDLLIHMVSPAEIAYQTIQKRHRGFETDIKKRHAGIQPDFFQALTANYTEYIEWLQEKGLYDGRILIVNRDAIDFFKDRFNYLWFLESVKDYLPKQKI